MKMKAAIYHGPGDIRIEQIERPKASDGVAGKGVVCKIRVCGITDTLDLPAYKRPSWMYMPGIALGYEWSGDVVEIGPKVTAVKVGDRVSGHAVRPCLKCGPCLAGDYNKCSKYREGGAGHGIHGGLAEYMLFPYATESSIRKLPDEVSYHDATLTTLMRLGLGLAEKVRAGDYVVIMGVKFLACATLARLKQLGIAKKIIVTDISKKRLEKGREFGADVVIDELNEDVVKVVMKETEGACAQVIMETSGRTVNFQRALEIAAEGNVKTIPPTDGGVIWLPEPYDEPFPFIMSLKGGTSIRHPWGTIESPTLNRAALEFIRAGYMRADKVVSHVFPLEKTKEAFETLWHDPDAIKVVVEP